MEIKVFFLVLITVFLSTALSFEQHAKIYPRYIDLPDGEGNVHKVDLEAKPDVEALEEINRNPANNIYLLFTRNNRRNPQTLTMFDTNSITNSFFNPKNPTAVIAHGWLSNQYTDLNPALADAFLVRNDSNIIVLDWMRLAASDYVTAANGVPAVGRGLGQFLQFLSSTTGAAFNSMHLVGLDLGAHLVGNAGRELGGRVARVTGLDPAGPLWTMNSNRLSPADGIYVEAIHTDGGPFGSGIGFPIATADFFPNRGMSQPGCISTSCNRNRAWELFAVTVIYNSLVGTRCSVNLSISPNSNYLNMGNDILDKWGTGVFCLTTRAMHPF